MRIGIDVRCLAEGRRTGVEEYTLNLLSHLFEIDKKNEYLLFFNSYKTSKACFGWIKKYPNVHFVRFNFPNKLLNLLFWYFNWPKIDRMLGGCEIFFMPNIIFSGISKKTKLIATIHDLSFERYPETFSIKRRLWHFFVNPKKICQRADKIITVSQSTKMDLISIYGVKPEKIQVILSGVSENFKLLDRNINGLELLNIKEKYGLPYKFILYLGTIEPRKNIIGVIRAFNNLQRFAELNQNEELKKYHLVIAGYTGWLSEKNIIEIKNSPYKNKIIRISEISEEEKKFIYNLSSLFVYPSKFEGFGFPPLEAMSSGIPVIASNNSSLPEIIGNAGIMVDPNKPHEIYFSMKEILTSEKLRNKLKDQGVKKSQIFKWESSAKNFLEIIQKFENL